MTAGVAAASYQSLLLVVLQLLLCFSFGQQRKVLILKLKRLPTGVIITYIVLEGRDGYA